jgi:hypothetical protein
MPAGTRHLIVLKPSVPDATFFPRHGVFDFLYAGRVHDAKALFFGCGYIPCLFHEYFKEGIGYGEFTDVELTQIDCLFRKCILPPVCAADQIITAFDQDMLIVESFPDTQIMFEFIGEELCFFLDFFFRIDAVAFLLQ